MLSAFRNYLSDRGIVIGEERGNTIFFNENGLNYFFVYDRNEDLYYFRLILPNVLQVTESNRTEVLQRINDLNVRFKVAKTIIISDNVWILVEQFVYSMERIFELFDRTRSLLRECIDHFRQNRV